jgi:hypothetical protein
MHPFILCEHSELRILFKRFPRVDSLCIIQDDDATKMSYLNNMASIYAYASVTIIAAQYVIFDP